MIENGRASQQAVAAVLKTVRSLWLVWVRLPPFPR